MVGRVDRPPYGVGVEGALQPRARGRDRVQRGGVDEAFSAARQSSANSRVTVVAPSRGIVSPFIVS